LLDWWRRSGLQPLAAVRVGVSRDGYRKLRRFGRRWLPAIWAVEGATGLGASLTSQLAADGVAVVDLPAKLARRVRMLSTGHGRKSDQADALSVGIAAHAATRLNTAFVDEAIAALRVLTEHRDDQVRSRTQTINRLHACSPRLIPAELPRGLTADTGAAALRSIRPRAVLAGTLREVAVELLSEVRRPDRRIAEATASLSAAVAASGTTLTNLHGIGDVIAAKVLARSGAVTRFRSESAFASYCGADGSVLRRRPAASPVAGRRPAAELRTARHSHGPDQATTPRSGLLPAQTSRREDPQRSHALPETAPRRHRLRTMIHDT
jgi:transposase